MCFPHSIFYNLCASPFQPHLYFEAEWIFFPLFLFLLCRETPVPSATARPRWAARPCAPCGRRAGASGMSAGSGTWKSMWVLPQNPQNPARASQAWGAINLLSQQRFTRRKGKKNQVWRCLSVGNGGRKCCYSKFLFVWNAVSPNFCIYEMLLVPNFVWNAVSPKFCLFEMLLFPNCIAMKCC